ncbi:MAG: ABC transporter permease [Candidatus Thermoplasmatota archaeon]|nr:ABC transporter permease [Candidatus Thermoplasmatota archaeon]MCL5665574.1 ABC transporter permease [Candidatus Thermoplasmatota archaeon]
MTEAELKGKNFLKNKFRGIGAENSMWRILFKDGYFRIGAGIVFFFFVLAIVSFFYLPYNPVASTGPLWSPPSYKHWFGTTGSGQDLFSQWMVGSQPTLLVAILSAAVASVVGVAVGISAGYFRRLDEPMMRMADVFLILPVLPLLIVIAAFIRPTNFTAALIIGVFSWPWMARSVRSAAVSIKKSPYIEVSRMNGVPNSSIMKSIFMHTLPIVLANAIFSATGGILFLAYMDYLGVGPVTSYAWGTTLFYAQQANALFVGAWWWIVPSGISIAILATGFSLLGYSMENAYRGVSSR